MKVWLTGLGFSLLYLALAVNAYGGNVEEVAGHWYVLAKSTDCKCMLKHKDHMQMVRVSLSVQEPDSVTMETSFSMKGKCQKLKLTFTKNSDEKWEHTCDWGKKIIEEVHSPHEGTLIIKATHEKNGKACSVWVLLSRERDVKQDVLSEFKALSTEKGFTDDQIIVLPPKVDCIESE